MTGSALSTRYAAPVILLSMSALSRIGAAGSHLAVRAVIGGSLTLFDAPDRATADTAGAARTLVHVQPLAEIAGTAVGADVIAQRGAAGTDGCIERGAHRTHQAHAVGARQPPCATPRTDARAKQGFAGVDVADAGDQPPVHEHLLDGGAARARDAMQIVGIEAGLER